MKKDYCLKPSAPDPLSIEMCSRKHQADNGVSVPEIQMNFIPDTCWPKTLRASE